MDAVAPPRCLGCAGCPTWPAASTTSPRPTTSAAPATTTTRSTRSPPRPAADRGCSTSAPGPGASPRPLLEKGFDVVAVEPLDEMRAHPDAARSAPTAPWPGTRRGAAAARRQRRRRRLQRRLALVRRRPRRRRARARRQARRGRGRVRDVPALVRQRRRARLVARSRAWSTRRCPRATIRLSSPAGDDPDVFEGHPAFEEIADARGALRAPHGPRGDRRALGIDVVRRGAARGSAHRFPRPARRDARAARRRGGRHPLPRRAVDHSAAARASAAAQIRRAAAS